MDKIKAGTQGLSIFPVLPLKTLRLQANHFQTVEATDRWTLYYVDSGSAEIGCAHRTHHLTQSQGVVLQPTQSHHLLTFSDSSAAVIQLEFYAAGREVLLLRNKLLSFDQKSRKLLRDIVDEAEQCQNGDGAPADGAEPEMGQYASGHYLQLLCEQLMIQLKRAYFAQMREAVTRDETSDDAMGWEKRVRSHRRYAPLDSETVNGLRNLEAAAAQPESSNLQLFNKLLQYLQERVYDAISLDELVAEFHFSKTHLSQTFKAHSGQTILNYFNLLKVEEAKRLILDTDMNLSQISNKLNFSSLHYFSRLFKKHTSMSPSEFRNSIIQ